MIGNHAVVLDDFETSMRPSEVRFCRLPIWIQCHDLPFNWLNKERGESIAKQIGDFIKLDTTGTSRGWGQSLRARIWLNIDEPIQHCIQVYSKKRKELIQYPILYEKLPYFCFSCGLLGHSAAFCPSPAERDEEGDWPYDSLVRAPDTRKIKKEPGLQAGEKFGGGGAGEPVSQRGPLNPNTNPNNQMNPFVGMSERVLNFGSQKVEQFSAQGRGRGGRQPPASRHRQLALGTQMYAPKNMTDPPGLNDDRQGIKRNALLNSPSKIDCGATDARKKRVLGDVEDDLINENMTEDLNLAEAVDQPRLSQ
jgi:hypothetical protein